MIAEAGGRQWYVHVADDLADSDHVALAVPLDDFAQRRLAYVGQFLQARASAGERGNVTKKRSRTHQIHQAILQALDGECADASHRALACAVYGPTAVNQRWTADGDMRARIRYFLKRGRYLIEAGYRKLVYA